MMIWGSLLYICFCCIIFDIFFIDNFELKSIELILLFINIVENCGFLK